MARKLKEEIKQRRPFAGPEEEVYLNVMRTADALTRALEQVLRGAGLSPTQYNVLRILRGAGKEGLRCREQQPLAGLRGGNACDASHDQN